VQLVHVAGEDLAGQRAAMHGVDPVRLECRDPIGHLPHGVLMGEDAHLAVEAAHCLTEILSHHRWLVAGLHELRHATPPSCSSYGGAWRFLLVRSGRVEVFARHHCVALGVARRYEFKRRAERQEQTRRRIVEAAIELHRTVGPARTSISAVAARAGVQRQTLYRHFPDERALGLACSGLYQERNPPSDPAAWRALADPEERVRHGLAELYAYYEANEGMLGCVIRDAEIDPRIQEIIALRLEGLTAARDTLADGLVPAGDTRTLAALDLAVDFYTWRLLSRRHGLDASRAAELMASLLRGAR
jgi:AcrR family transcriptional regulator